VFLKSDHIFASLKNIYYDARKKSWEAGRRGATYISFAPRKKEKQKLNKQKH